eukprot:gene25254-33780_t
MIRRSVNNQEEQKSLNVNAHETPISIALGENKLTLQEDGKWLLESSDMQKATAEVLKATEEKENLIKYLKDSYSHIEAMKKEILDLKEMKANLLDLLLVERQEKMQLQGEVAGYKEELKESCRIIVQLRKIIPKQG